MPEHHLASGSDPRRQVFGRFGTGLRAQEGLYAPELPARAAAAERAAALFRSADALPALLAHGALVAALARCLREDGRRSGRLCTAATGAHDLL